MIPYSLRSRRSGLRRPAQFAVPASWDFAFGLGTPTRLYFAGSWVQQDNLPDSGLPVAALPGGVLGHVRQKNFYGLRNDDFDDVTSGRVLTRVEHDVNSNLTLRNQFVYGRTDRDALTSYIQNATSINTGETDAL